MHEISLLENVLQLIQEAAQAQGFSRVRLVRLEIGELAGVEEEALHFSFDIVMHGSLAQGAKLEIIRLPGQGRCRHCAILIPMATLLDACPQCGSYGLEVMRGTEMRIKELEVE